MNPDTIATIDRCAAASNEGRIHFGEVVATLAAAGVESYWADYRTGTTTYYLGSGETHLTRVPQLGVAVAFAFDAAEVQRAIRGAQQGNVHYPEFVRLTRAAGCVGYMVWLAGRHVSYFGRRGETHVERFPD